MLALTNTHPTFSCNFRFFLHLHRVSGPNEQFIRSIRQLQSMKKNYDAVFVMEADARPWKGLWLDRIVEEVTEKRPFSILGSENHGMVWKQNRNSMPIALQHHLTGNSVFNLTDPFFNRFVNELEAERETFYHAIVSRNVAVRGLSDTSFHTITCSHPFRFFLIISMYFYVLQSMDSNSRGTTASHRCFTRLPKGSSPTFLFAR